jgi:type VI protein secretion system component VasK
MSRIFASEIGKVAARAKQLGGGLYRIPWYIAFGEPLDGKSSAIRAMNLTWDKPPTMEGQYCQYWISNEAVIVEAREPICGPNRNPEMLRALCEEILRVRPREPLDGILLVVSAQDVAERQDEGLEAHAQHLRSYLVEACKTLQADIPVYVVVNRYDTLWGFAEVFQWTPDRAREEQWGYLVPVDVPSQNTWPKVDEGLRGLAARIEATCLSKLSSEDGVEQRIRAYQHLVESRLFIEKLKEVSKVLAFSSAYERAPWMRAIVIGCAVPGTGDRIRAGVQRFINMGLAQNPYDPFRSPRPGGLPLFGFVKGIVLPEKELVPTKVRWRDDLITIFGFLFGIVMLIVGIAIQQGLIKVR